MKPVFALIGRPNVGKSTLFNQLTKSRQALVADIPGLTRDRQYGNACWFNKSFIVIDTGGIGESEQGIDAYMREQSETAMVEADHVLFIVDARAGLTPADLDIAQKLRTANKNVHLIVNKIDGMSENTVATEFYALGLGDPLLIAASHGRGVSQLIEHLLEDTPEDIEVNLDAQYRGIRIALIGRPNVGKSTLVNRMLGEERVVVFDMPGTTRDSIYIPFEHKSKPYTLIDTAGVRRKGRVTETIEKFSVVKTLQAVKDANVVLVVLDAKEGIVEQDLHMIGFALDAGRALVIVINKWDGLDDYYRRQIKEEMERRFNFIPWARIHLVSALYGAGIGALFDSIEKAYASANIKISTNRLTQILADAVSQHNPPMVSGRRIKLRYAHMGGQNPPVIVVHGNQTEHVPQVYMRYLENTFRKVFKLEGTPIQIEFKSGENPFAGRKNVLSERDAERRRRLIQQHKKRERR